MEKVLLLDLCCGAGGCAMGYYRAALSLGIEITIVGVDIKDQKNYPFVFYKGDAVEFVRSNGRDFTHIHASPPCQIYSRGSGEKRNKGFKYPDLLDPIRDEMYKTGLPGVIENVEIAPVRPDLLLNGTMFGLKVIRKRRFECVNWFCLRPGSGQIKKQAVLNGELMCVAGHGAMKSRLGKPVLVPGSTVLQKASSAMGIDWMAYREIKEAIPPAYTQWIGERFFQNKQ